MRKIAVFLLLMLLYMPDVWAQKMTIKSFELKADDKSAVEFERKDNNQQPCALLKVKFNKQNAVFEGNVVGNVVQKNGEYWVYISEGTYQLHIKQADMVPLDLNFRDFNIRKAAPGATYLLVLQAESTPKQQDTRQYLALIVDPIDSKVIIDGKLQQVKPNGTVVAYVGKGKHTYQVSAPNYLSKSGEVEISDEAVVEKVILYNDNLHVYIDCIAQGSKIYIDGVLKGDAPWQGYIPSGTHSLEARAPKSKPSIIEKTFAPMTFPKVTIPPPPVISERPQDVTYQTFTVKGVTFNMIDVKGGTFRFSNTYDVKLTDYAIGETEVTQELWEAVMGKNPSSHQGQNCPVDNISLKDCEEFVRRLSKLTGKNFHIPTSAQWEFAAKGGVKSHGYKYSGSNDFNDVAFIRCDPEIESSYPVKSKFPNELGIYDMTGNIEELCLWHPSDYSKEIDRKSLLVDPGEGSWKFTWRITIRGGNFSLCYFYNELENTFAKENRSNPDSPLKIGLRIVLD